MPCYELEGKKYTAGQLKKVILKTPDNFLIHVADEETLKKATTEKRLSEFDELLDKKIDAVEIPTETQNELNELAANLTPEETEIVNRFGEVVENATSDRGRENEDIAETGKSEGAGRTHTETVEQTTETEAHNEGKGGELREGAVSEGEGDKFTESVIGKTIEFEFAGSPIKGRVVDIDKKGNYKVKEADGTNHTVKPSDARVEEAGITSKQGIPFDSAKWQKASTSDPITHAKLSTAIDKVKKMFGGTVEITNDSREWNQALTEIAKKTGLTFEELNKPTSDTEPLAEGITKTPNGFVYKGKIYLNPDITKIKGDTVAHEAQHLANEVMRKNEPALWNRGIELAKQQGAIEKLRELYPHLKTDDAIADEFIADAVGKKVEQLNKELSEAGISGKIINQITDWIDQAKDWIKSKLGWDSDMTFDQFVDKAAKLQVRGNKIGEIDPVTGEARFQFPGKEEKNENEPTHWTAKLQRALNNSLLPGEKLTEEEKVELDAKIARQEAAKKRVNLKDAQLLGKQPEPSDYFDKSVAPDAKETFIVGESSAKLHGETRDYLIKALRDAGVLGKQKTVVTWIDPTTGKPADKGNPNAVRVETNEGIDKADMPKVVGALGKALQVLIEKNDVKLHTEAGKENKKSFQLDLVDFGKDLNNMLGDELQGKKTPLQEIVKDLRNEHKLFDIPDEDTQIVNEDGTITDIKGLTKLQREAKRFYVEAIELKTMADHLEQTDGAFVTGPNGMVDRGQVMELTSKDFKERVAPVFDKLKDAPILKQVIPYLEKYGRSTSGVTGFGKLLTGKADGLINAGLKAVSQAPGKAFTIKNIAETMIKPLTDKGHTETRETFKSAEAFEKTNPVDINKVSGQNLVSGGYKLSPKEINDIYLTLRQSDANKAYFSNEREANNLESATTLKEKDLAELSKTDLTKLDKKAANAITKSIDDLSNEIETNKGEIANLKKDVQGFRYGAIDSARTKARIVISRDAFEKIREYAIKEFPENNLWEVATKYIHPLIDRAFRMVNGTGLKEHDKFYPLTHGDHTEINEYTKEARTIDDFRSAKYRKPAKDGNDYIGLSSDIKMQSYINSSAHYAALAPVIRNMDAVMNGFDAGKDNKEWWNKRKAALEDPARFMGLMGEQGEFGQKLKQNFAASVLYMNPFIPPKEIGAVFLGTSEIPGKYLMPQIPKLVKGLGGLAKSFNPLSLREYDATEKEMMQRNDMANMRLNSGVTDYEALVRGMKELKIPGTDKKIDLSKGAEPLLMAHRMVQKAYWEAAKAQIGAEQPELKDNQYWKAVGDIYERTTLATQPAIDAANSPSFTLEKDAISQGLSLFGGQGFVNMNNIMQHTMEYMHDPSSATAKYNAAKTVANVMLINTLILTAIDGMRPGGNKRDKDKEIVDFSRNVTRSFPIFGPLMEAVINKYQSPVFGYGTELPTYQVLNEGTDAIAKLAHGKFESGLDEAFRTVAATKGIPVMPVELTRKFLK